MAIKTGTLSSTTSKNGAYTTGIGFDKGSYGVIASSSSSAQRGIILYGFNFDELRDKKNVTITDIRLSFNYKSYTASGTYLMLKYAFCRNFNTSGTNPGSYTDLGDGLITVHEKANIPSYTNLTVSGRNVPNTLSWINSNIDAFLNGSSTNSFGLYLLVKHMSIQNRPTLTIDYTYGETEYVTVTTSVSPAGAGTVTPTHQIESGSTATVSAIPNTGYKFSHWLLNGADSGVTTSTISGVITANTTVTAVFVLDKINKIYVGTSQPKEIYVGTQKVKAIYVGTIKVYG